MEELDRLDAEEQWELTPSERHKLVEAVAQLVGERATPAQIRTTLQNYWQSAPQVEALRDACCERHTAAWAEWLDQAKAILRYARCAWAADVMVDIDDLAQIAMLELCRSLPSYRFASRFSTWAYQVIVHGVQRHLRNMAAQKRVGNIVYGLDPRDLTLPAAHSDAPEVQALGRSLEHAVAHELEQALGARNAEVFRLWASEDLAADAIGKHMGLSVPRVYAIIAQARQHLRRDESLQRWYEAR